MKVRVLKGLPTEIVQDRRLSKTFAAFCVLKQVFQDGHFSANHDPTGQIEFYLGVSTRTAKRRLDDLRDKGLLTFKNGRYHLRSWADIAADYSLEFSNRFYYIYTEHNLELVFDQKAIYEYQKKCKDSWKYKLDKKYPSLGFDLRKTVSADLRAGEVFKHQVISFASNGLNYSSSTNFDLLPEVQRADFNIGSKKLSKLFGYNGKGSMAYRKRRLEKAGLITVQKRQFVLDMQPKTTPNSRKTKVGAVHYRRDKKQLILTLPDSIKINAMEKPTAP